MAPIARGRLARRSRRSTFAVGTLLAIVASIAAPPAAAQTGAGPAAPSTPALSGAPANDAGGSGHDVSISLAPNKAGPPPLRPSSEEETFQATKDIGDVLTSLLGGTPKPPPTEPPAGEIPLSFSLLPNIWSSPAAGLALGVAVSGALRTGSAKTTTTSNLFATVVVTTKDQMLAHLKHTTFARDNEWIFAGDLRLYDMSQDTYGLGTKTPGDRPYLEYFKLARIHEVVYRRLVGSFYYGLGYELDHYYEIHDVDPQSPRIAYEGDLRATTSSGITNQFAFDARDSAVNPTRGAYFEGGFHAFPKSLGSTHPWQTFHFDGRTYVRMGGSPRHVLALWAYAWVSAYRGPYLDLPSVGWDTYGRTGRGYVQGRFRGQSELYGEVEYRLGITADGFLGAVVFGNVASFSKPPSNTFDGLAPAAGAGLRMMLMKRTSTNLTLDMAWGRQSSGFYFNASETF